MPTVRPSARLVLFVIAAFVAASLLLLCAEPPATSACPIEMPQPLRVVYNQSELVVAGRVGDTVEVEKVERATLFKSALHVSSVLKGESKEKVVSVYHMTWGERTNEATEFAKGATLLLFLNRAEKYDGYEPVHYNYGVKSLPDDALKVYLRRLDELAAIMRSEKPDPAEIAEWLVRCAEEPATRWEGAFELAFNASLPGEDTEEEEDTEADTGSGAEQGKAATAEVVAAIVGHQVESAGDSAENKADAVQKDVDGSGEETVVVRLGEAREDETDYAALLTPAQKERLAATLLKTEEFNQGDYALLRLVASWRDARLVPFLLQRLACVADKPPYQAEQMMQIVAYTLKDRSLIEFVEDYGENVSYEDLYAFDDESDADADAKALSDAERAEKKKEAEEQKAAAAEARFQRSGKLRHFLALAEQPQKP